MSHVYLMGQERKEMRRYLLTLHSFIPEVLAALSLPEEWGLQVCALDDEGYLFHSF
jgi:hypothetical protein